MPSSIRDLLKKTSALRSARETAARYIGDDPLKYRQLLECATDADPDISKKACWILELVIFNAPDLFNRYPDYLFSILKHPLHPSGLRPVSKIIAFWCDLQFSGKQNSAPGFTAAESELLTEYCFGWLLSELPVAIKVHSMEALYQLGKRHPWIHHELKAHLVQMYPEAQPAFRARARKLLKIMG